MASLYGRYADRRDSNNAYNDEREGRLAALQRQAMMDERQATRDTMQDKRQEQEHEYNKWRMDKEGRNYSREEERQAREENEKAAKLQKKMAIAAEINKLPPAVDRDSAFKRSLSAADISLRSGDEEGYQLHMKNAQEYKPVEFQPGRKTVNDYNKPFLVDGSPNRAYQQWVMKSKQPRDQYSNVTFGENEDGESVAFQSRKQGGVKIIDGLGKPAPKGGAASGGSPKATPAMINHTLGLIGDLEKSLAKTPRSTTGLLSGPTRAYEAVVSAIDPTNKNVAATTAEQKKEAILLSVKTLFNGKTFDSGAEQIRFEKAIGKASSGSPVAMAEGLADLKDLIGLNFAPQVKGNQNRQGNVQQASPYPTATGPNGQKVMLKDGKWQPIR